MVLLMNMPQMSNMWWLSLIIYFSINYILMNMTIYTYSQIKFYPIQTTWKKKSNNWMW